MLIGITGKSGSGKSYISNFLSSIDSDIVNLNIDEVGHSVLLNEEVKKEIIAKFGSEILENNNINRKKLGELVFLSRDKMKTLTEITWSQMVKIIDQFLLDNNNKTVILEWILLPKSHYFVKCDIKILINVPYEIRLKRAIKRDSISKESFDLREQASIDYSNIIFDYVIDNSDFINTKGMVKKIYDKSIVSR